ncbi:MAG TPA: LysR family transcriptional regulator [Wenzhouxiangella sp.]
MLKPTLNQLKILQVVAEEGSIVRAADRLHLTPPTLSIQLSKLAEHLGTPLYEVVGRRIELTGAGRDTVAAAQAIVQELGLLEQRLAARVGVERGRLTVATVSTGESILPKLIGAFQSAHPGLQIALNIVPRDRLLGRIDRGEDDLYLMTRPPNRTGLLIEPVGINPLVMIAHPNHPWLRDPDHSLAELASQRFLSRERGSGTRSWIADWLSQRGMEFKPALELGSNEAIKQAVMAGHGIAMISLHAVFAEVQAGQLALLHLPEVPMPAWWYAVRPLARQATPATSAYLDYLKNEWPKLDAPLINMLTRLNFDVDHLAKEKAS